MKPASTVPIWLQPKNTLMALVCVNAAILIPGLLFVSVQTFRSLHRAALVACLQPGTSRAQVLALVGQPTDQSEDGSAWYFRCDLGGAVQLPLFGPEDRCVEFAPDGRVTSTGVLSD